jgi:hypothetical protein
MKPTYEHHEYHHIFKDSGPYTLVVYQNGEPDDRFPDKRAHAADIMKFIEPDADKFKKALFFDECLLKIESYSIHPKLKEIRIHVEPLK